MTMRMVLGATIICLAAPAAMAELKDEEHIAGDKLVRIAVFDTFEIMTVGRTEYEQMQVLSGADIRIVAFAADADSVALIGEPVIVAEVFGSHSCETGDARDYYVVTLGEVPAPEGPLTTCAELTVSVTPGAVVLEENPMGEGEFWAWSPGNGFKDNAE